MKITQAVAIACLAAVVPAVTPVYAQQTQKTAVIDSANKQLQRGSKSAKSSKANSVMSAKSASAENAKQPRVAANPSITPTTSAPAKASLTATDTSKAAPAVRRSPTKTKPPAR